MSARKSLEHRLNDWLDEGPRVAPHDLLHAVLEEIPSVRQERSALFVGKWRIPMFTFARLGVAAIAVAVVAAIIIATRPAAQVGTESSQTPTPTAAASPSTFTSKLYAYSISVPPGWTATNAGTRWDGTGAPDDQSLVIDSIVSPGTTARAMIAVAAPTTKDLAAYTADGIAVTYTVHKDTCPAAQHPNSVESITIGGEPGELESINCGILINIAYTVHAGQGYRFTFRDEGVAAATDPTDRATFLAMLASVQFK